MTRPKDDSPQACATARRLALSTPAEGMARQGVKERQGKARLREAAALSLANAKAQEKEALNAFRALPLREKVRLVSGYLMPAPPAAANPRPMRPGRGVTRFAALAAATIRESIDSHKTQGNKGETKKEK